MWSGEVQGSGYPTQWALNPSAYQNLPNEQVDWATLAQQWIKMKETFPVDQVPPAPPPPSIKGDVEAGEAPMDMSKDDIIPSPPAAGTSQGGSNWGSWNSWQQWDWNWSGPHGAAGTTGVSPEKAATVPPYTYSSSNAPPFPPPDTPAPFDYNHRASVPNSFDQPEYWSGNQAPFVRNKSSDWRAEQREVTSRKPVPKVEEVEPDTTTLFDAAKRKQLPAWIREGLEKMEREKQKKMERERQLKEREDEMKRRKLKEEEALASGIPVKSKFDTDSEESEKEIIEEIPRSRKSRFEAQSPVPTKSFVTKSSPPPVIPVKRKSRDEIMQEVMQQVRYTLTNILMKVTNEEMQKIAEEVHADFRTKAPATQLRKTPAFTSLTGKLGLGIYDSDSEDSSAESDGEPVPKGENRVDSDEELRERIHRKRQEFARIERDIEQEVELQEEKEREREQRAQENEEEASEENMEKSQVETKLPQPCVRPDVKTEEPKAIVNVKHEESHAEFFTPERPYKSEGESSEEHTEDSDEQSSSDSSSRSSSSLRHKKSRKSMRKRKDKKSRKRKRKRSSSRGSDRKKSSHRKSSHRYDGRHRYERSRSRSRSRSRGHYDEYRRKSRNSSDSSYHRRSSHQSYSRSPDYSRGKKSSHRSRD